MTTEDGATTGAAVTAHRYLRIRVTEWFGREDFQRCAVTTSGRHLVSLAEPDAYRVTGCVHDL